MYIPNPKELSLEESRLHLVPKNNKLPRHKQGEKFLKGPIPYIWLTKAGILPGKALHVAIALWFQAGIIGKPTVKLSPKIMQELGVERRTGYRALKSLENAGLVSVERHVGRTPIVTLLDI